MPSKTILPFRADVTVVTAHRGPTTEEIRFGYGAIHYRDFPVSHWVGKDGLPKVWIKSIDDGLRYYR